MSSHDNPHITEVFSIEFDGPATKRHEMSAAALAQSLLAMDALARRALGVIYEMGRDARMVSQQRMLAGA